MEENDTIEVELYSVYFTDYPELNTTVPSLDMALKVKRILQIFFLKKVDIKLLKKLR